MQESQLRLRRTSDRISIITRIEQQAEELDVVVKAPLIQEV